MTCSNKRAHLHIVFEKLRKKFCHNFFLEFSVAFFFVFLFSVFCLLIVVIFCSCFLREEKGFYHYLPSLWKNLIASMYPFHQV